jgi:hypothetical protein
MQLGFRGTEKHIIEGQADGNGLDKPFGRQRLGALDLSKVGASNHRDLIEYTFVAHVRALE